jgi:hypothetical protein
LWVCCGLSGMAQSSRCCGGAAIPIKDSGAFGVAVSGLGGRGAPVGGQKFTAFFPCWSRFYFRPALHTSVTSTHLPSSHRNTHTTAYDMVAWSFLSYSCTSCALAFSQLVIVLNGTACTTGIWPAKVTISSAPLIVSILLLRDFFYGFEHHRIGGTHQAACAVLAWRKVTTWRRSVPPCLLGRRSARHCTD